MDKSEEVRAEAEPGLAALGHTSNALAGTVGGATVGGATVGGATNGGGATVDGATVGGASGGGTSCTFGCRIRSAGTQFWCPKPLSNSIS